MQKSLFKLTVLTTLILGISACGGDNKTTDDSAASSDAKAAKTLLYCSEGSPAGLIQHSIRRALISMRVHFLFTMAW